MAFITWTEKLSVGVQSFDNQHMVLIDTLNDLHTAMLKGQARAVAGKLLDTLVGYTRDHFASEEAMMEAAKYPALAMHSLKHRQLTKQVGDYVARFEKGDVAIAVDLLDFLSDWLTTHIQGEDKKYGPWLNEHGVN